MKSEEYILIKEAELQDLLRSINLKLKSTCVNEGVENIKITDFILNDEGLIVRLASRINGELVSKNFIHLEGKLFEIDNYFYDEDAKKYDEIYVDDFDKTNREMKTIIEAANVGKIIKRDKDYIEEILKEIYE